MVPMFYNYIIVWKLDNQDPLCVCVYFAIKNFTVRTIFDIIDLCYSTKVLSNLLIDVHA